MDGADASQASAIQATLISKITGQRMGYNYWSSVVMWVVQLPMDLHVQGTVNVHAYIGSTSKLSGLFSGGGYAMGIVDIDENQNEVQEFIAEAPYTIGSNPFTSTPTQYSTNTAVDYVFKKGHFLGFTVGLGATVDGFTATVYFDSQNANSGATLPVEETIQTQTFSADGNTITVSSASAIQNFQYNQAAKTISFLAQGINYTPCACTVSIPKNLMQSPFTVTHNTQPLTVSLTEEATNSQLSFNTLRSTNVINIVGSAPAQTPTPTTQPTQTTLPTSQQTNSPSYTSSVTPSPPVPELGALAMILVLLIILIVMVSLALKRRNPKDKGG